MNVLLIAYSFPPFQDAQALRWYYLANALADLGVQVEVLAPRHPGVDASFQLSPQVAVHRVFPGPLEYFSLRAKKRLGVDTGGNPALRKTGKFKLLKTAYWALRNLSSAVLPGDLRTEWFPFAALFALRKLDLQKYDGVITSHEPGVDSLLGLLLKKRNRALRWVADFGDPYVAPYTPRHKLWMEAALEKSIYRNADALIFTNSAVVEHVRAKYPFLGQKEILVLEQGFSHKRAAAVAPVKTGNETFTLLYTGTLYRDFRNPDPLIQALKSLDFDFHFLLAGRNEEFLPDFAVLGDRFRFLGFVNHFEALDLQKNCDLLVHLGNRNPIQVPGKFYEYLGARRPILSIHAGTKDHTSRLAEELTGGASCAAQPEAIKKVVELLHRRWKDGGPVLGASGEDLFPYTWEHKARLLHESLLRSRR